MISKETLEEIKYYSEHPWNEKTAKEMFEELGYEENYHIAYIMYYNKEEDRYIWFFKDTKTIEVRFDIDIEHLKAINKQIEELGWN